MEYTYETQGTCASQINFSIHEGILHNVSFEKGCNGNLKSIALLVEGKKAQEVAGILKGVNCNGRGTSCADQFALAIEEALKQTTFN